MDTITEQRFWEKVDRSGECWLWEGAKRKGYGALTINCKGEQAHRISWLLIHGKHSKKCVLHKCDNKACVNPNHLFEGTQFDNMTDMYKKGRSFEQKKTHCYRGHEFDFKNTIRYKNRRRCRICKNSWRPKIHS